MNRYLWIAIIVTAATLAVHALLAWWFLFRKPKDQPKPENEDP